MMDVLRTAIRKSGMSLYAIAKATGTTDEDRVDADSISRFVRGATDLRLATADKIAAVLGLELRKRDS